MVLARIFQAQSLLRCAVLVVLTVCLAASFYEPTFAHKTKVVHQVGLASWYGKPFRGKRTASGERFDDRKMTAAHPSLPMDTLVRVTHLKSDRSVVVRINDRGPFRSRRIIDLSRAAAKALGFLKKGTAKVAIEVVKP